MEPSELDDFDNWFDEFFRSYPNVPKNADGIPQYRVCREFARAGWKARIIIKAKI